MSRKVSRLADGDDYKIVIQGFDCEKGAPIIKRDEEDAPGIVPMGFQRANWNQFEDSLDSSKISFTSIWILAS